MSGFTPRGILEGNTSASGMGRGCLDSAALPVPKPLGDPGSSFANEKVPWKDGKTGTAQPARSGKAAPRSPAFVRGSKGVDFVPVWPCTSPIPAAGAPRGYGGFSAFPYRGKDGTSRGLRAPVGPGALPLAPAPREGAGTWVRFIFGAAKFFPRRELVARGGRNGR